MTKKINIANISIDPQTRDVLKQHAEKREISVGKIVKELVEKHLTPDKDVVTIILKVPINLKGDKENLKKWVDLRANSIVKALS